MTLEQAHEMVCSRKFIHKVFLTADKNCIKKYDNGNRIEFSRQYDYKDLKNIENVEVPENFSTFIETNMKHIHVIMDTEHRIIKHTDNSFIIKYTSMLQKPDYVKSILGNTKIILYSQYTKNKNDPSMTVIHFTEKIVNSGDEDDDTCIINAENDDVITHIYKQETLKIDKNLLSISETLLGHNLVHDFVLPFINNVFNTAFTFIKDVYTTRLVKFLNKKNVDIYKKK
jgi:hypothetical protein